MIGYIDHVNGVKVRCTSFLVKFLCQKRFKAIEEGYFEVSAKWYNRENELVIYANGDRVLTVEMEHATDLETNYIFDHVQHLLE